MLELFAGVVAFASLIIAWAFVPASATKTTPELEATPSMVAAPAR